MASGLLCMPETRPVTPSTLGPRPDGRGQAVRSGVYFYQLRADQAIYVGKMLYLR